LNLIIYLFVSGIATTIVLDKKNITCTNNVLIVFYNNILLIEELI